MSMCVFACVARFWWPHSPCLAASQVFSLPLTLGDKKNFLPVNWSMLGEIVLTAFSAFKRRFFVFVWQRSGGNSICDDRLQ